MSQVERTYARYIVSDQTDAILRAMLPIFSAPAAYDKAARRPPCKNHDLCTNPLTLIECGFMLCILYVRNGGRYGVYGYARVSTDGQSLTAQLAELKAAKCEKIFQEKISGARSDRKQLMRLMALLAKDDVLVVTRLDRLARSTRDLLNLLGTIGKKGQASNRSEIPGPTPRRRMVV